MLTMEELLTMISAMEREMFRVDPLVHRAHITIQYYCVDLFSADYHPIKMVVAIVPKKVKPEDVENYLSCLMESLRTYFRFFSFNKFEFVVYRFDPPKLIPNLPLKERFFEVVSEFEIEYDFGDD
jgi:hypothetical protein